MNCGVVLVFLLLASGCFGAEGSSSSGALSDPVKLADVPGEDLVPLHLYVSNQSWDPELVDIRVTMNGVAVVEGGFAVEGQHTWVLFDLMVPRGTVDVRAEALDGTVVLEQVLEVPDERWAVLEYWFYPDEDPDPFLQLGVYEESVAFAELAPRSRFEDQAARQRPECHAGLSVNG